MKKQLKSKLLELIDSVEISSTIKSQLSIILNSTEIIPINSLNTIFRSILAGTDSKQCHEVRIYLEDCLSEDDWFKVIKSKVIPTLVKHYQKG